MRSLHVLGLAVVSSVAWQASSHPLCYYDDKPTDPEMVLSFCPAQDDGACCNDLEEAAAESAYNLAGANPLTGDCATLYLEVRLIPYPAARCLRRRANLGAV